MPTGCLTAYTAPPFTSMPLDTVTSQTFMPARRCIIRTAQAGQHSTSCIAAQNDYDITGGREIVSNLCQPPREALKVVPLLALPWRQFLLTVGSHTRPSSGEQGASKAVTGMPKRQIDVQSSGRCMLSMFARKVLCGVLRRGCDEASMPFISHTSLAIDCND